MKVTEMTAEQIADRWEAQRAVKNLMGKYVNCLLLNRVQDIWDLFWSRTRDDVSLGFNHGFYFGADDIKGYYDAVYDGNMLKAKLLQKSLPDHLGGLTDSELYGVGPFHMHPLSSAVIEVADDGKTAKGIWHCMGAYADIRNDGPSSSWIWGYYAGDFINENGDWKIWHLIYLKDIDHTCGESWAEEEHPAEMRPEFEEIINYKLPEPTISKNLRDIYSPRRPFCGPPRIPEAYATFKDTFSYGAKGGIF